MTYKELKDFVTEHPEINDDALVVIVNGSITDHQCEDCGSIHRTIENIESSIGFIAPIEMDNYNDEEFEEKHSDHVNSYVGLYSTDYCILMEHTMKMEKEEELEETIKNMDVDLNNGKIIEK